jgi:hypothetical protein
LEGLQVTRAILLLALILPSLAGAQTPTVNGLVKSLNDAVATITPQNPATITAQQLVTFGVQRPTGTPAIRCVIRLTLEQRIFLGIPNAAATITEPADLYAVMQVAGPNVAADQVWPPWLTELVQTCGTPFTLTAPAPSVILAARTNPVAQSAATGFACACRGTGTCNWTPPLQGGGFGAATPAPKNMTIPAGLWSGAGCSLKPCVELYGSDSMPNVCK